jgi:ribosomal protein L11 methyltransferase
VSGYLALSVELKGADHEIAEAACFAAGALSVTLTDAADDAILEPKPGELRLWPHTVMQAMFAADAAAPDVILALAAALDVPASTIRAEHLRDRRWEREWLKDFHAMRFGRRLWVVPHHEPAPEQTDAVVVRLDPGLAFGTGTHATTALCLAWLDANLKPGDTVIDYGCGSGVLGIAAARLGAARVDAFDIDPQALIATRDNALANAVSDRVLIHETPATLPATADVVLANILAGTLIELAQPLTALVRPGGQLALSGILRQQAHEVLAGYQSLLELRIIGEREGWTLLAGRASVTGATR